MRLEYIPEVHAGKEVSVTVEGIIGASDDEILVVIPKGDDQLLGNHIISVKTAKHIRITPSWGDYDAGSVLRVLVKGNPDPITVAVCVSGPNKVFRHVDGYEIYGPEDIEKLVAVKYDSSYDWEEVPF